MSFDKNWDKIHSETEWLSVPDGIFVEFYELYYKNTSNLLFVDLGCGTGAQTLFLATKGQRVLGVDASGVAISKLLRNLNELKLPKGHVTPMWADVINLNIAGSTVDCVIEIALFEQLPFKEALEVAQKTLVYLKPGGRFLSRVCTEIVTGKEYIRHAYHRTTSLEEIKEMFQGFNFHVIGFQHSTHQVTFNYYYVDAQRPDPCQESMFLLSQKLVSIMPENSNTPKS